MTTSDYSPEPGQEQVPDVSPIVNPEDAEYVVYEGEPTIVDNGPGQPPTIFNPIGIGIVIPGYELPSDNGLPTENSEELDYVTDPESTIGLNQVKQITLVNNPYLVIDNEEIFIPGQPEEELEIEDQGEIFIPGQPEEDEEELEIEDQEDIFIPGQPEKDEGELEIEDQEEIHTPEKPQEPQALSQPQVPSQPQAPSQPVRVSHPTSDNPKTGDSSLMVSLAVLSIAITGFVISKKKVNI